MLLMVYALVRTAYPLWDDQKGAAVRAKEWAIEAVGLQKAYGKKQVLGGVDLAVRRGSIFALLGPNGAGKTTVVSILSTLVRQDAGRAMVAGFDVVADRRQVRRRISLTGQTVALDDLQTGEENLRMFCRISGLSAAQSRRRTAELLDQFDLADAGSQRVGVYSGGMRRRLDVAAGLVGEPAVVFLDEPTTGLDLPSRQAMWRSVTALVRTGVTVFLTTQYLEEADQLADRIAVMSGGSIVAEGSATELKNRVAEQRLELVLADDNAFREAAEALGARVLTADAARLLIGVATDGSGAQVRGLLDDIDPGRTAVRSFAVHAATLDDVFLTLTGRTADTGRTNDVASEAVHV